MEPVPQLLGTLRRALPQRLRAEGALDGEILMLANEASTSQKKTQMLNALSRSAASPKRRSLALGATSIEEPTSDVNKRGTRSRKQRSPSLGCLATR